MTWRLQVGFTARTKRLRQLNVPELVRGLNRGNMGMNANFVAVLENLES